MKKNIFFSKNNKATKLVLTKLFLVLFILVSNTIYSQWTQMADLPQYKWRFNGFSIGTKGYVVGGYTETASTLYGNNPSSNLWIYDSASNTWSAGPNYPGGATVARAFSFVINGIAYVGIGDNLNFYAYNPSTNTWTQKANRPSGNFYQSTTFVLNNDGYVLSSSGSSTLIKYNPSTDSWTSIDVSASLPERAYAFSFVANNKAYVGGGNTYGTSSMLNTFYEFNPSTNTFTQKASHPSINGIYTAVGYSMGAIGVVASGYSDYTNHRDRYLCSRRYYW